MSLIQEEKKGKGKGKERWRSEVKIREREIKIYNMLPNALFRLNCQACLRGLLSLFVKGFSGATARCFVSTKMGEQGELTLNTKRQMVRGGHARRALARQSSSAGVCMG